MLTRHFRTKNGSDVVLEPATPNDAQGLFELELAIVRDGRGVVRSEQDVQLDGVRSVDATNELGAQLIARAAESGAIVGEASLRRLKGALVRHVAVAALGVHPSWQAQGLGRALMQGLLDWARATAVERVELYTRADNMRARALYASLGFKEEAVRARFIRLGPEPYVDDVVMCMFL